MTATRSPASAGEELLWLTERFLPGLRSTANLTHLHLDGPADADLLAAAISVLRARHPALRTRFTVADNRLWREVDPVAAEPGIRRLPAGTGYAAAFDALVPDRFDLARGDLLRAGLAPARGGAELYLAAHHIVLDGYAEEIIAADLARAYAQLVAGEVPDTTPRPRTEPVTLTADRRDRLTAYWARALEGVPSLPDDRPRQSHRELLFARVMEQRFVVPRESARSLRRQARAGAMSVFPLLLTAVGRAVAELAGADDFCVGTPISTRRYDQRDEVCCELNMVPIRITDPFGTDAAARLWERVVDATQHADLPRTEIIAAGPPGDDIRMPLYQVVMTLQNWARPVHRAGPVRLRTLPGRALSPLAELMIEFYDQGPDDLTGIVQVPAGGAWAPRLTRFGALLAEHLAVPAEKEPR
jgi:hypothetical protein